MKNKQLLALESEALQFKDALFGLESVRRDEKKKEHDKLIVAEPTDRLGQFFWEHAREEYIHEAKETQLGDFNVPAYNFFKNVQALHAELIALKGEVTSLAVENNHEFKDKLRQLKRNLSATEDCFLSIEISMISACYRRMELAMGIIEQSIAEVRLSADAFNQNPSMAAYKNLCSKRDYFAYNTLSLEFKIKYLQRESARNAKAEHIESAQALDKVLSSVKRDLAYIDNDIENLRYQHSAVLYDQLDGVSSGTYEGGIFAYLQFYWLITLSYLYKEFISAAPAISPKSSTDHQDSSISISEIRDAEEDYTAAAHLH